ncbi:DUF4097 domain-containing protein [bacterium]|nr:DUF4097 domain-containing protein [bacterium]
MKARICILNLLWITILFYFPVYGDQQFSDRTVVKFGDPARPGVLKIVSGSGDISITGYEGKDVIIEAKSTVKDVLNKPEDEKAKGMKRLTGSGLTVTNVQEDNAIVINRSLKNETDLVIQVPFNTSLQLGGGKNEGISINFYGALMKNIQASVEASVPAAPGTGTIGSFSSLGAFFNGDITANGITGEIEANTLEGDITLNNISGGIAAHSVDGEIQVTLKAVDKDKPMAFSTVDGDIDITFPALAKATVTAKNVDGEIYTDFDMEMVTKTQVNTEKPGSYGIFNIGMFGNTVTGKINGGGPDIQMTTVNGNIYIRKGK